MRTGTVSWWLAAVSPALAPAWSMKVHSYWVSGETHHHLYSFSWRDRAWLVQAKNESSQNSLPEARIEKKSTTYGYIQGGVSEQVLKVFAGPYFTVFTRQVIGWSLGKEPPYLWVPVSTWLLLIIKPILIQQTYIAQETKCLFILELKGYWNLLTKAIKSKWKKKDAAPPIPNTPTISSVPLHAHKFF